MSGRTLPREPWRGGQICGYQTEYGVVPGRLVFCGEPKAHGLYFCAQHDRDAYEETGSLRMAPGNAIGDRRKPVELSWEPFEGDTPVVPTPDELAAYEAA